MLCTLLGVIIWLIIAGFIYWLVTWLIGQFPLLEPFGTAVRALCAVIAFLIVLNALLALVGMSFWPVRVGWAC